ncbi:MAG TPA: RNA-binding protein [Ruminococcaceae bacterium]|jgi:ribosomal 50S subunit-recycling heat shock protein|nr:RNA-binding protein [Oscillospiraceae bacterium]
MRLDKYLKVSRLIKRRTVANEACDAGRILVNGKAARASYEIREGDELELQFGTRSIRARVLAVNEYANRGDASQLYEILP